MSPGIDQAHRGTRAYRSLQTCRGAAAVMVVMFHLGATLALAKYIGARWLSRSFVFGDAGVEFFFVLSGFIILQAHRRDIARPERIGAYLRRRFLRIYPIYWLVFVTVLATAMAVPALRASVPHSSGQLIKALLLVPQDPAVVGGSGAPVIIVAWTLQYEVSFYLSFALLILNRWLGAVSAVLLLAPSVIGAALGSTHPFWLQFLARDYVWLFVMGMSASALHQSRYLRLRRPLLLALAGIVGFALVAADKVTQLEILQPWRTPLYGLASASIILGLARAEDRGQVVGAQPVFQLLGDASYVLYLVHFPLISVLCKALIAMRIARLGAMAPAVAFVLVLSVCLVVAAMLHLRIEKRLLTLARPSRWRLSGVIHVS